MRKSEIHVLIQGGPGSSRLLPCTDEDTKTDSEQVPAVTQSWMGRGLLCLAHRALDINSRSCVI